MTKSPDAFRTISEVADWLETPTHVLRFWESRFTQVKPVKRAGGRRYYRPSDMELLGGIKKLLHEDGMTIRGVQKLLREEGIKHVANLSPPVNGHDAGTDADVIDTAPLPEATPAPMIADAPQEEADNVVPLSRTLADAESEHQPKPVPEETAARDKDQLDLLDDLPDEKGEKTEEAAEEPQAGPVFSHSRPDPVSEDEPAPTHEAEPEPEPQEAVKPCPALVDVPNDPDDDDESFKAEPGFLTALRRAAASPAEQRPAPAELQPLYDRLAKLRDRMQSDKRG